MLQKLQEFQVKMSNEKGQGLVEYALIIFLVSIGCIVGLGLLTGRLNVVWGRIVTALT
jgi:Flp pilus assembly pilin Flp